MDIEKIRKQAQSENTSLQTLAELAISEDRITRQYIAENPNAPVEVLEKLGLEFSESITANPAFNLLLLENPAQRFLRLCLAHSSTTAVNILEKLTKTKDIEILCAIASNPNCSDFILRKLAVLNEKKVKNKSNSHVRYHIALNPNISIFLISILAVDQDELVRHNLATNPNVTLEIIENLAVKDIFNLQREFIDNAITPLWIIKKLLNSNLTVELKTKLAQKTTFSEILEQLAVDDRVVVRRAVSSNYNTPTLVLEELLKDNYPCTHDALLNNPNSSIFLKQIIRFIQEPNRVNDKLLADLTQSKYTYVRKLVAKLRLASKENLLQLATDSSIKIRKTILYRDNLDPEIIDAILETTIKTILNLQPSIKYSKESYILCLIARNNNTADSTIRKLALLLSNKIKDTPIHVDRVQTALMKKISTT